MSVSGALLVAGLLAFAAGALLPPSLAFTGTPAEQLSVVSAHPQRWIASAVGLGIGVVLTLAGLAVFHVQIVGGGAGALSVLALVGFGVGAVLFLSELAFRATVTVAVATAAGATSDWFGPIRDWAGALYWAYSVLAYLAVAATGAAILQTGAAAEIVGWVALVFGLVGAAVFVTRFPRRLWWLFDIPGLLYLVTGGLGVGILVS
jgi:hypothetical protein